MFYLLEDNRIIDRLSIREDLNLPFEVDFYVQKDELVLTIDHIYFEHINITKKAENVFDLLENGDLVKYKYETKIELSDFQNDNTNYANYLKDCDPKNILAIYKPDANGNYIKVWELKEEK